MILIAKPLTLRRIMRAPRVAAATLAMRDPGA
jgi:hypothetical protein